MTWCDSDRFTLRAGDMFSGSIRSSNDSDTIALQLDGGTPYRIEVEADRGDGASGRLLRESVGDYIAALEVDADGVGQRVVQFDEPTTIYLAIDLTGWWGVGDYTVSLKENDDFFHGTTGQIAEELATGGYWRDTGQRPGTPGIWATRMNLPSIWNCSGPKAKSAPDGRWTRGATTAASPSSRLARTPTLASADAGATRAMPSGRSSAVIWSMSGSSSPTISSWGRSRIRRSRVQCPAPRESCSGVTGLSGADNGTGVDGRGRAVSERHDADVGPVLFRSRYGFRQSGRRRMAGLAPAGERPICPHPRARGAGWSRAGERGRTVYYESVFTTGILGQRLTLAEAEAYDEAFHDVLVTIKDDGGRDRIDLSAFRGPGYIDNVIDLTPGAVSTPAFYDGFRFRLH